jgi:hypothetical protein
MQYHYVVGYDSDNDRWFVEPDATAYFQDGNVWYQERSESADWGYFGWYPPEEGSPEEALDYAALRVLQSCIPGILPSPTPQEA